MTTKIKQISKAKINNPILIEGLPGIGNVGKIAADFLVDSLNAKKIYEIHSYGFPHSVFINDENLVDLPKIEIYHKPRPKNDILIMAGDIQPLDEKSCYEFCDAVLDILQQHNTKEIITLGGIGLPKIPKNPKVYCTANEKPIIEKYRTKELDSNIFGVVGPIIGVTGLLVGLASQRKIPAIAILAQTYSHPTYLGIKGAKEILDIINKKLNLKLDLEALNEEIKDIEKEVSLKSHEFEKIQKTLKKGLPQKTDISYIG
ncbi:PAC2 family protein [Candidatus Woesearchaeota archaeon]|nr:PAC2 family protein [Candidatus Woesearchaeota archaeon]